MTLAIRACSAAPVLQRSFRAGGDGQPAPPKRQQELPAGLLENVHALMSALVGMVPYSASRFRRTLHCGAVTV